jgi:hypothetical protein
VVNLCKNKKKQVFFSPTRGEMTTEGQLREALAHVPHFAGVFASDELPPLNTLPQFSSIIVNYAPRSSAGNHVGHWVAMLHLRDPETPPQFFDSFGFRPDGLDKLLNEQTHFQLFMSNASRMAGHGGKVEYSRENIQCEDADVCGELAVYAVEHGLPQDLVTGEIRRPWKRLLNLRGSCEQTGAAVRRIVGVR